VAQAGVVKLKFINPCTNSANSKFAADIQILERAL